MIQINIDNVYSARKRKLQYEKHDFIAMQTQNKANLERQKKKNRSTAYVTVPKPLFQNKHIYIHKYNNHGIKKGKT